VRSGHEPATAERPKTGTPTTDPRGPNGAPTRRPPPEKAIAFFGILYLDDVIPLKEWPAISYFDMYVVQVCHTARVIWLPRRGVAVTVEQ
jgi:hypothetical protein